jgi:hypothetical protein
MSTVIMKAFITHKIFLFPSSDEGFNAILLNSVDDKIEIFLE